MNIALDLDEVIADTLSPLILFHNETFGTHLKKEYFLSYNWWEVWGGTKEQAIEKFFEFTKSKYFSKVLPIAESVPAIQYLSKNNNLYVITGRQQELLSVTTTWLNQYFPNTFKDIFITNHPQWSKGGNTKTKIEIIKQIGAQFLVEDNLLYARECEAFNIPVLLFDYPWNQEPLPTNTKRIHSWSEVISYVTAQDI